MESSSNNLLGKFAMTFTFHLFEFDNFRNNFLLNYLHFSQNSMFSVSRIRLRWEMMLWSSSAMMKCPLSSILCLLSLSRLFSSLPSHDSFQNGCRWRRHLLSVGKLNMTTFSVSCHLTLLDNFRFPTALTLCSLKLPSLSTKFSLTFSYSLSFPFIFNFFQ